MPQSYSPSPGYGTQSSVLFARTLLCATTTVLMGSVTAQNFLPPAPFGGDQAVKWLFEEELNYSARDLDAKVTGEVELTFTVGVDGAASSVRISKTLSEDSEAEARRLLSLIRWHPASVGGTVLDKAQVLAVPFNLKRYLKAKSKEAKAEDPFAHFPADGSLTMYQDRGTDSLAVPMIPKGWRGLPTYFGEHLQYPEDARRRDMQGKVVVDFVVEPSGNISNLRTVEALSGGCDNEAMRLVRSIGWKPAFKDGKRVRSILKLDIQFRLDANQRP